MPSLGEFLGAVLSDAARARVRADVEAVKIAGAYVQDPLLKNLPVPRFRLPDITVDVPMLVLALSGTNDSTRALPFEEPTSSELRAVVRAGLRGAGIRVPRPVAPSIPAELIERAGALFQSGTPRLLNPASVSDDIGDMLVEIVVGAIGTRVPDDQLERLRSATAKAMSALLTTKLRLSLSWQVAVTAGEISAQGSSENIVRLRLTISEDGYEAIARENGDGFLLTPE
jgi:hypothetical protein